MGLLRRGEDEIETEIERNASGYDKAAALLLDLRMIADEGGTIAEFARRLRMIRERHARKERFIERLAACQARQGSTPIPSIVTGKDKV